MDDIVTQIQSYIVENTLSSIIIAVLLGVIVALIIFSMRLNKKYQNAITPKYGFLGKPLYSMFAFALVSGGLVFAMYTSNRDATPDDALAGIEFRVEIQSFELNAENKEYALNILPYANNELWGSFSYDVYWTFINPDKTITTVVETNLNKGDLGGVTKRMQLGKTLVKVNAFVENKNVSTEIELDIN